MRGWTIGPLGAVILVFLLGGCAFVMLGRGSGKSDEELIRAYYREQGASPDAVTRLEVGTCELQGESYQSAAVYRCPLKLDDTGFERACFAIDDDDKVVAGGAQLRGVAGCQVVIVETASGKLVEAT